MRKSLGGDVKTRGGEAAVETFDMWSFDVLKLEVITSAVDHIIPMTAAANIPTNAMFERNQVPRWIFSFLVNLLVGHRVGGNEVLTICRDCRSLCVDAPVLQ